MSRYFNDIKVGDRIWTMEYGECEVIRLEDDYFKVIITDKCSNKYYVKYGYNGVMTNMCKERNQTAFWSKPNIIAPPCPFSLERELKKLTPRDFKLDKENTSFGLDYEDNRITFFIDYNIETLGALYFKKEDVEKMIDLCDVNKISALEFKEVFNKIFVKK